MLLALVFIAVGISIMFFCLSRRFENSLKNKKFKPLSSFPLISVLIPAYNSEKNIKETLESIKKSDYPNKEIIVINDSDDKTPEIAESFGCKVIRNKKRKGKWFALNIGAKKAKGKFLMILDSDTTLQKKTISTLLRSFVHYENSGERVGIVAPRYMARNKKNLLARFCDMEQSFHQSILKVQMNLKSILSIRGCCMLIKKSAFADAGGFSPSILEDGDFSAKVIKSGYSIKYEPRALVKTREPETYAELLHAKRRYGKGTLYCLLKHKKPFLFSIQSAICFYPCFVLGLAFIGTLLFQSPLSLTPLMLLFVSFSLPAISTTTLLIVLAVLSAAGILLGTMGSVSTAQIKAGIINTALPFFAVFVPLVTYAYFKGVFSAVSDKIHNRPEFNLNDW